MIVLLISGCTDQGGLYDSSKHSEEEFSAGNTIGLILGAAVAVAAASNSGGYGGGDYDWDWDYQPSDGQWVCRGTSTGRYAEKSKCQYDAMDDSRWPG
jgi:hypothetical protein